MEKGSPQKMRLDLELYVSLPNHLMYHLYTIFETKFNLEIKYEQKQ